jgi:hypothetical protein
MFEAIAAEHYGEPVEDMPLEAIDLPDAATGHVARARLA